MAYRHQPFPPNCTPAEVWAHYDAELDKIEAHFAARAALRAARTSGTVRAPAPLKALPPAGVSEAGDA